jgi:hypothetical protein
VSLLPVKLCITLEAFKPPCKLSHARVAEKEKNKIAIDIHIENEEIILFSSNANQIRWKQVL